MENNPSQPTANLCGLVASAVTAICALLVTLYTIKQGGNK